MQPLPPPPPTPEPLVSVCMPIYNGARYLAQAVASVLAQTHANLELLVFDDASTDGSLAVLEGFQDPRLRVHRNACNLGPEGNWNQALNAGRGKYLKLFHQDDLLAPDCLARQTAALEACPGAVLVFCGRTIIGPGGRRILDRVAPWPEGPVDAAGILRGCARSGTNLLGEPSAVLFRRDTAGLVGAFHGRIPYLIDLDYWIRLLDHGTAYCLRAPLASFRLSPGQWSTAIGKAQAGQFGAFLDQLCGEGRLRLGRTARLTAKVMAWRNQVLRWLLKTLLRVVPR